MIEYNHKENKNKEEEKMTVEKIMSGTYEQVKDMMEAVSANRGEILERVDATPALIRGYVSRKTEAQLWAGVTDAGRREYWIVTPCYDNTVYFWKKERWVVSNMFEAFKRAGAISWNKYFANLSEARRWARGGGSVYKLSRSETCHHGYMWDYKYHCEGYER